MAVLSYVRAKRSSQRRNGAERSTISQSVALPRMAKATIAATIWAGLPSCWPSISRKPSPVGGTHEFRRHHEHPAEPHAGAQRDDVGRHHRGQQDAPHHGDPGQPEDAADLDDLAVDRHDRTHDAEIDREEHADRDQDDLRGLEDPEPENEQRHPGDRGNGAQRLQGRVDQPVRQRRIAGDRAEHGAGDDAEGKARDHPRERGAGMELEFPGAGEIGEGRAQ